MSKSTKPEGEAAGFREDIHSLLRRRVREAIEITLEEELSEALGCGPYERSAERLGYRNGKQRRCITTALGARELEIPRGRVLLEDGSTEEYRSQIVPRYARRTREVDEAILGAYLAGVNSRRIKKALAPLLGEEHLSKSAVSRVVSRLKEHFARWSERDLSDESYSIVFLDGFHLKVRLARRVVSVPVLAVLGVAEDGTKVLLAMIPDIHQLEDYPFDFIHQRMRALADELGWTFVDFLKSLGSYKGPELWTIPGEPHPNAFVHKAMAEQLAPFIK